MAQEIYSEYTDQREPFGIDESWLDVTASTSVKGEGMKIAKEMSSRIKYELGVTVVLVFPGIRYLQSSVLIIKSQMPLQSFPKTITRILHGNFQ